MSAMARRIARARGLRLGNMGLTEGQGGVFADVVVVHRDLAAGSATQTATQLGCTGRDWRGQLIPGTS